MNALERRIETLEKIHSLENPDTVHFISWEIPENCIMKTSYGDITWKSQPKETKSSFTSRVKEEVLKLPREHSRKEIYLWLFNE
ncbi:MAG: hypothetical protein NTY92_01535 [Nitrosospira sp.]|nr:hypothetical protein [Nitrosospira sp.]